LSGQPFPTQDNHRPLELIPSVPAAGGWPEPISTSTSITSIAELESQAYEGMTVKKKLVTSLVLSLLIAGGTMTTLAGSANAQDGIGNIKFGDNGAGVKCVQEGVDD
jgi:hypothetical protein